VLLTVCTLLFLILNRSSRWWSVFWVLFQAKSNPLGGATDDALTYTQVRDFSSSFPFSTNRSLIYSIKRARLLYGCSPPNQLHQGQMSLPFISVIPQSSPFGESSLKSCQGPQTAMPPRMMNGIPQRPNNFVSRSLPNGVGGPSGMPGPGPFSQPNGTPNPGNPPHPPPQAPPFMLNNDLPRPPMGGPPPPPGQVQQIRGVSTGPFQSPPMAHSPPGAGVPPSQRQTQYGASPPHLVNMGRGMISQSPMNPNLQGAIPQPGQPPFGMAGRPPSRTTTPGSGLVQSSPSLVHRQVNGDLINMEILQIPNAELEQVKGEFGLAGKDISALTILDKVGFLPFTFRLLFLTRWSNS